MCKEKFYDVEMVIFTTVGVAAKNSLLAREKAKECIDKKDFDVDEIRIESVKCFETQKVETNFKLDK